MFKTSHITSASTDDDTIYSHSNNSNIKFDKLSLALIILISSFEFFFIIIDDEILCVAIPILYSFYTLKSYY